MRQNGRVKRGTGQEKVMEMGVRPLNVFDKLHFHILA
jgi:hypothetical protein